MKFFYYNETEAVIHVLDSEISPEEPWVGTLVGSVSESKNQPHPTFLAQTFLKNAGFGRATGIEIIHQSKF